jgi:hypothetical protein
MAEPLDSWDKALAFALTLPGTVAGRSWKWDVAKVSANDRGFLWPGHEAKTSFAVMIDRDTVEILMETDPESFWQSPHYAGYDAVLVRYSSPDPERVREVIERARDYVAAKPPPRKRKKKS